MMQLVEQHIITRNNPYFKVLDELCFNTKNLYNSCLYVVRQAYIDDKTNMLYELHNIMKNSEQYKVLPAKVASSVLLMVQKNFKAFFKATAEYYKNPSKFTGRPGLPRYLNTTEGRYMASYTNQAISKKIFKKSGKIKLSGIDVEFRTKISDFNMINCVRVVPRAGYYVIEVIYTLDDIGVVEDNKRYIAIDLGVNNLATLTSNVIGVDPKIINGKPLKSMNQYYNKKMAEYVRILDIRNGRKTSKRTKRLTLKRKNKIDNYLHKSSKQIISYCVKNNVNTLIIGKNDNWKQDVNNGCVNNQNFVNIPHSRFIDMLRYKCEMRGINIKLQEESYTSKSSFLNLDEIPTYGDKWVGAFSGYRVRRGLYKIKGGNITINSDVNGSYNILRKAIPNAFANGIEGIGVYPEVITLK